MLEPSDITIEVGSPTIGELDSMLGVMCEAFDMPFTAAREIFHEDPYFVLENKRVLRVNGRVVSCLTIVEHPCNLGDSKLVVAGVAGVATLVSDRGHGFASRLIRDTISYLEERRFGLSALFPVTPSLYDRLGWSLCGSVPVRRIRPDVLAPSPHSEGVRKIEIGDLPRVTQVYDTFRTAFNRIRDPERWKYILAHVPVCMLFQSSAGAVEGYLLADVRPQSAQEETGRYKLRVLEMHAVSQKARQGLEGFVAGQRSIEVVEIYSTSEAGSLGRGVNSDCSIDRVVELDEDMQSKLMVRIIDWLALCDQLRYNWRGFRGSVDLRIRSRNADSSIESVRVTENKSDGGVPTVRMAAPDVCDAFLTADAETWSQVCVGHIDGAEALQSGLLSASSKAVADLAIELFPRRYPAIPIVDRF